MHTLRPHERALAQAFERVTLDILNRIEATPAHRREVKRIVNAASYRSLCAALWHWPPCELWQFIQIRERHAAFLCQSHIMLKGYRPKHRP